MVLNFGWPVDSSGGALKIGMLRPYSQRFRFSWSRVWPGHHHVFSLSRQFQWATRVDVTGKTFMVAVSSAFIRIAFGLFFKTPIFRVILTWVVLGKPKHQNHKLFCLSTTFGLFGAKTCSPRPWPIRQSPRCLLASLGKFAFRAHWDPQPNETEIWVQRTLEWQSPSTQTKIHILTFNCPKI